MKKLLLSGRSVSDVESPQMMSAIQKLGIKDYIEAAVLNPNVSKYESQIKQLLDSNCEVGYMEDVITHCGERQMNGI